MLTSALLLAWSTVGLGVSEVSAEGARLTIAAINEISWAKTLALAGEGVSGVSGCYSQRPSLQIGDEGGAHGGGMTLQSAATNSRQSALASADFTAFTPAWFTAREQ